MIHFSRFSFPGILRQFCHVLLMALMIPAPVGAICIGKQPAIPARTANEAISEGEFSAKNAAYEPQNPVAEQFSDRQKRRMVRKMAGIGLILAPFALAGRLRRFFRRSNALPGSKPSNSLRALAVVLLIMTVILVVGLLANGATGMGGFVWLVVGPILFLVWLILGLAALSRKKRKSAPSNS